MKDAMVGVLNSAMNFETPDCPVCEGRGEHQWFDQAATCTLCGGVGEVSTETLERWKHGQEKHRDRVRRGVTLRDEAKRLGVYPTQLSRWEQGLAEWGQKELPLAVLGNGDYQVEVWE